MGLSFKLSRRGLSFSFDKEETRSSSSFSTLKSPATWFLDLFGNKTNSGVTVTEETALGLSAVYACVSRIASTIATLPFNVYEREGNSKVLRWDHPVYNLIHVEPNQNTTASVFWETLVAVALLWGNGYAIINRNGAGKPISLEFVHDSKVDTVVHDGKLWYVVQGYVLPFHSSDIFHLPALSVGTGRDYKGKSPIRVHAESLGINIAAEKFGASFFGNGAHLSGVLEVPDVLKDTAYQRLKESWHENTHGLNNSHKTKILEQGAKYTRIGIPPNEAQFIESRKYGVTEVCRIYGMPPHMIGDLERSTNNNIEQQSTEFVQYTLLPWLKKIELEADKKLFSPSEKGRMYTKFNVNGLLRGDVKTRGEYYKNMVDRGVFSINDVLELEDRNIVAGGDRRFVQRNMIPLDKVDEMLANESSKQPIVNNGNE